MKTLGGGRSTARGSASRPRGGPAGRRAASRLGQQPGLAEPGHPRPSRHAGIRGSPIRGSGRDFRPRAPRHGDPGRAGQPGPAGTGAPPGAAPRGRHRPAQPSPAQPSGGDLAGTRSPPAAPAVPRASGDGPRRRRRARVRGGLAPAVRARRPRAFPRERARRGRHGAADARGRHSVRQRLPPAGWAARARCGTAARARVRRPGRGPLRALGAHLRRHGGRRACRRRLPGLLQERPQPLRRRLHGLPHAAPRTQPGARLPDGEERPPCSRTQSGFLVSAPEVRADPAGPGAPAPGAGRPQQREATTPVNRTGQPRRRHRVPLRGRRGPAAMAGGTDGTAGQGLFPLQMAVQG